MEVQELEGWLFGEWERICRDEEAKGFAGLPHRDQAFHDIWMLEAELNNGGFSQYMFNSTGDRGLPAVEALREVGAPSLANLCERFFALLSTGAPAADQDARQAQLDEAAERMGEDAFEDACSALEAEFYAGEDELRRLLVAYVDGGRRNLQFIEHAKQVVHQIEALVACRCTLVPDNHRRPLGWRA